MTGPEVGAQVRNRRVDQAVAEAYAALARREAGRLNRDGDFAAARHQLTRVARRIHDYAGDDPQLNLLVSALQQDAVDHEVRLGEMDRKVRYAASEVAEEPRRPWRLHATPEPPERARLNTTDHQEET